MEYWHVPGAGAASDATDVSSVGAATDLTVTPPHPSSAGSEDAPVLEGVGFRSEGQTHEPETPSAERGAHEPRSAMLPTDAPSALVDPISGRSGGAQPSVEPPPSPPANPAAAEVGQSDPALGPSASEPPGLSCLGRVPPTVDRTAGTDPASPPRRADSNLAACGTPRRPNVAQALERWRVASAAVGELQELLLAMVLRADGVADDVLAGLESAHREVALGLSTDRVHELAAAAREAARAADEGAHIAELTSAPKTVERLRGAATAARAFASQLEQKLR